MQKATLKINADTVCGRIAPEIYGQFSEHLGRCIYDGIYVGEDSDIPNVNGMRQDIVDAFKRIKLPVLRWPGGCFADEYHWRDGIGPKDKRRRIVNTNWGQTVEDNSFGTHEFMELCRQIGCEPYVALNLGSGTVREASEWVEYMTAAGDSSIAEERAANGHPEPWKVKYIGIGNENWGCGGSMEPEYYASEYKRYQQFCKDSGDNKLYKIACGPNGDDYRWTEELMKRINKWHAKAISLHYYTLPGDWEHKGSATVFDGNEYYTTIAKTLRMDEIVSKHLEIMDKYDPDHDISLVVDEWGAWYDVEPGTNPGFLYQQNTMRDALIAAINLNIFNSRCDRISMANIAQAVNVLQAMVLTEGNLFVKTPTYHVFDMYKEHQGAKLLKSSITDIRTGTGNIDIPALSQSVSIKETEIDKIITITVSNASLDETVMLDIDFTDGLQFAAPTEIAVLTDDIHAHNTFENPDRVVPACSKENWDTGKCSATVPAASVVRITCHVR